MHKTSYLKAASFVETCVRPYVREKAAARVLDIGSKRYGNQDSYKQLFDADKIEYVGLDLEAGDNVDVVPNDQYIWSEFENESFDFCVSGQTFEHNPFFWITFAEIARVLKPGGQVLIIAPGRGTVHRYPVDCWRFYPDYGAVLCAYTGLELVDSYFEEYQFDHILDGAEWCDSCFVASKPELTSESAAAEFYARLEKIVSTLPPDFDIANVKAPTREFAKNYESKAKSSLFEILKKRLRIRPAAHRVFRHL